MNLLEVLAWFIIVAIGYKIGEILSGYIGVWGWIIGFPSALVIVGGTFELLTRVFRKKRNK